jgi:cytoskeletal protein CcmA (bactofilin family)
LDVAGAQSEGKSTMNMGQSIVIKGELSGEEDLTFDGRIEGKVSLPNHILTVGKTATVNAEVLAKTVVVLGSVTGNVTAKEKFELQAGGSMDGALSAPRVAMAEGSRFDGKIEMPKKLEKEKAAA